MSNGIDVKQSVEFVRTQIASGAEMDYVRKSIQLGIHRLIIRGEIVDIGAAMVYLNTTNLTCPYCGDHAVDINVYDKPTLTSHEQRKGVIYKLISFVTEKGVPMNIDHLVAKSDGGANHPLNYTPACTTCNQQKGKHHNEDWVYVIIIGCLWAALRKQLPSVDDRYRFFRQQVERHIVPENDGIISFAEYNRIIALIKGEYPFIDEEQLRTDTGFKKIPKRRRPAHMRPE